MDDDLTSELLTEEHAGWQALTTPVGGRYYETVMTPDAFMVVPGAVLTRDQVRPSLEAADPWDRYEVTEARAVPAGDSAAVLVYRARAVRGDASYSAYMSTTYVRRAEGWMVTCHQQTPDPS